MCGGGGGWRKMVTKLQTRREERRGVDNGVQRENKMGE